MAEEKNGTGNGDDAGTDDAANKKSGKTGNTSKTEDKSDGGNGKGKGNQKSKSDDDADADDGGKSEKKFSQAELDAQIEKRLKREREKYESEKDLSDKERAEKELEDTKKTLLERDTRDNFLDGIGEIKKEDGLKLFRYYRADLEVDDKGNISNLKDIRKQAREDFPEKFQKLKGDGDGGDKGDGGKSKGGNDINSMIRRSAGRG